jgi:hypothetical protein
MLLLLLAAGILIFYPLLHHLPLANLLVVSSHTPTSQVALQALVFTASTVAIAMAFAASWIIIAVVLWAKAIAWAGFLPDDAVEGLLRGRLRFALQRRNAA